VRNQTDRPFISTEYLQSKDDCAVFLLRGTTQQKMRHAGCCRGAGLALAPLPVVRTRLSYWFSGTPRDEAGHPRVEVVSVAWPARRYRAV